MSTIIRVIAVLLISSAISFQAKAGASSVSDGGHGVQCASGSYEFLDSYELRKSGGKVSFGIGDDSIVRRVGVAISRLRKFYGMTSDEMKTTFHAAKALIYNLRSTRNMTNPRHYIEWTVEEPVLSLKTTASLQADGCRVISMAARVDPDILMTIDPFNSEVAEQLCPFQGIRNCVVVDPYFWDLLDSDQRAVLVVHEVFRFLPKRVRPGNTAELRQLVGEFVRE